jgi:hypothetical protein
MATALPPATSPSLGDALFRHLMLGSFFFLSWQAANFIVTPVQEGHIQLILLCQLEIMAMVLTPLLFGNNSVTHDINELNPGLTSLAQKPHISHIAVSVSV